MGLIHTYVSICNGVLKEKEQSYHFEGLIESASTWKHKLRHCSGRRSSTRTFASVSQGCCSAAASGRPERQPVALTSLLFWMCENRVKWLRHQVTTHLESGQRLPGNHQRGKDVASHSEAKYDIKSIRLLALQLEDWCDSWIMHTCCWNSVFFFLFFVRNL